MSRTTDIPYFLGERWKIFFANNALKSRHKFFICIWGCSNGCQNPTWPGRYDNILGHPAIALQMGWKIHISHNKRKIPCWCTLCATGHIHCRGDLKQAPQVLVLDGEGQHSVNVYSAIVHTSVVLVVWRIHSLKDLGRGENTASTNRGSSLWYCLDLRGILPGFHGLCVKERISVPMESKRHHGLVPVGQLSREMHHNYLMK